MQCISHFIRWIVGVLVLMGCPGGLGQSVIAGETAIGLHADDGAVDLVRLGSILFNDPRLSLDGATSCSDCHDPSLAFTAGERTQARVAAQQGTRNAPSLLNVLEFRSLFWDGRQVFLAALVVEPLTNPIEHGFSSEGELMSTVAERTSLAAEISAAWGISPEQLELAHIVRPLAAYVASLTSVQSAFDRFLAGDDAAISARAKHGYKLFVGRARCADCHRLNSGRPLFTDHEFHSASAVAEVQPRLAKLVADATSEMDVGKRVGLLVNDAEMASLGRFLVSRDPMDIGKFRTPSLRNVAITAPYMHDGSVGTLEHAVERELYDRDRSGRTITLSPEEKGDLVEFLRSLTDDNYAQRVKRE